MMGTIGAASCRSCTGDECRAEILLVIVCDNKTKSGPLHGEDVGASHLHFGTMLFTDAEVFEFGQGFQLVQRAKSGIVDEESADVTEG